MIPTEPQNFSFQTHETLISVPLQSSPDIRSHSDIGPQPQKPPTASWKWQIWQNGSHTRNLSTVKKKLAHSHGGPHAPQITKTRYLCQGHFSHKEQKGFGNLGNPVNKNHKAGVVGTDHPNWFLVGNHKTDTDPLRNQIFLY